MKDAESIRKRRFATNLLYSEGIYIHLDIYKNARKAEEIISNAIKSQNEGLKEEAPNAEPVIDDSVPSSVKGPSWNYQTP